MSKSSTNSDTQSVLIEITKQKEIEIPVPFYASVDGEDEITYVKVTREEFYKITITHFTNEVNFFKTKFCNILAIVWHNNECQREEWEEAVKYVKQKFNTFQ